MTDATNDMPAENPEAGAGVDRKLLELLVCPLTKQTLRYDAAAGELFSDGARLAYPIRDGIPIMLPDAARVLDDPDDDPTAAGRAALGSEN